MDLRNIRVSMTIAQNISRGHTMGKDTVLSATKLSSRPGRYAPPPETNSRVVSSSRLRPLALSMAFSTFSPFFLSSFSCMVKCLIIAGAALMLVKVVM